jgi:ribosomal protein S17E
MQLKVLFPLSVNRDASNVQLVAKIEESTTQHCKFLKNLIAGYIYAIIAEARAE